MPETKQLVGQTIDNRYYITRFLNEGFFGAVYRAEHRVFDLFFREVALKIFKGSQAGWATAAEIFTDAILLARVLDQNRDQEASRHLVFVHDLGVFRDLDNRGYVAMEFVAGGDLATRLARRRAPLPIADTLELMFQITLGLTLLHQHRDGEGRVHPIIHRDLHPGNILLTPGGVAKVADFGLATLVNRFFHNAPQAGVVFCQPPEAFEQLRMDPRADIYALGLIFYEALTLTHPFREVGLEYLPDRRERYFLAHARARRDFEKKAQPPSALNSAVKKVAGVDDVVLKCLRYYPGDRYPHAGALLQDLKELQAGRLIQVQSHTPADEIRHSWERGKYLLDRGDAEEARKILEEAWEKAQAYRLEEDFANLLFSLGQAYFRLQQPQEALRCYNLGLRKKPQGKYFSELAEIYEALGRPELAQVYRRQARDHPWIREG